MFADWFSGVIKCYDSYSETNYYFHIRNVNIVNTQILTDVNFMGMKKKKVLDSNLTDVLILYQNYISQYYRLDEKDSITIENESEHLIGNNYLSPLLLYFSNDHIKFPYNWENHEKNGTPNCKQIIENGEIYLTEIHLYS